MKFKKPKNKINPDEIKKKCNIFFQSESEENLEIYYDILTSSKETIPKSMPQIDWFSKYETLEYNEKLNSWIDETDNEILKKINEFTDDIERINLILKNIIDPISKINNTKYDLSLQKEISSIKINNSINKQKLIVSIKIWFIITKKT